MRLLFFALLICGACGSTEAGTQDASTTSDAQTTNDSSIKQDSSTDAGTSMDASDGMTTSDASDASMTLDAGPGTYTAYGILGGLDRLRIVKTVGNTCFLIQLVSPNSMGKGLTLPQNWGFEGARAIQPAAGCDPKYLGPIANSFDATSQSGTIQFQGMGIPQTIQSVMATLVFQNNPMWCPPSETFSAQNIMVQ